MRTRRAALAISLCLIATTAFGSWYDDYNDGLKAVRNGQWGTVVEKMTAAIGVRPKENNKERAYGTIFINYHPYYYRGVAYLNQGKYQQAISDLETATGVGPENLGTIEQLIQMAKTQAGAGRTDTVERPTPVPVPVPVPQPTGPVIDPAIRGRAQSALGQARARVTAAQQRNAASPQASQALQQFTEINTRYANAKSNDDLEAVIAMTDNVILLADAVQVPAVVVVQPPTTTSTTRPGQATDIILDDSRRQVRLALESYFNGDFDIASRSLDRLTRDMQNNAWLWAFLGASYYSQYAFEADESYRDKALQAFRRAKRLRKFQGGLPQKYFSRRIRNAFDAAG
jgi:tetratricopeptide (TPR) repeat protein